MEKTESVDLIDRTLLLEILDRMLEKRDFNGLDVLFDFFPEIYETMVEDVKDVDLTPTEIAWEQLKTRLIDEGLWKKYESQN